MWELSQYVDIPIVGIGGIASGRDAVEFLLAGATAVEVGTASFADPLAAKHVANELAAYCAEREITPADLVGKLKG